MGSQDAELRGPDLTNGVSAESLEEGVPFAGHAKGEAVILVRRGHEIFAVGGTCTHYSGPLADGIVVGEEIRCPWHHACFSLRTGDPTAAPALNSLPGWEVKQRGGKVYVGAKLSEEDALDPPRAARTSLRSVVIVGGGAAGTSVAEALRRHGFKGGITIVDSDVDAPYDRPNLSKDYLAGTAPEEWLPLRPAGFHDSHGIHRMRESVINVDVRNKRVALASGEWVVYDAMVIATGAAAIRIPIPGVDLPNVHVLRTLADCKALIASVSDRKHVVIAGASFIGMEAAAALRQRELEVTVVAPEPIPFGRVLGPEIGTALQRLHERHGVQFKLGHTLAAIEADRVTLDDGTQMLADVVLLGIGVQPRVEIAQAAGVVIDRGVVVNEFMETSVRGIYAAGDVARFPDARTGRPIRIEHWIVAQRQGDVVARNLLGQRVRYSSVPFFWTVQYDVTVSYVGHAEDFTHTKIDGSPEAGDCAVSFMNGDQLLACATIGRDRESLEVERQLETWVPA
jgi:NADPH-dependent 2,4-dienoyl-CoA reductase/sulfur reductase-like enzyme/nitrite reductase/ring-hydroxylating ferredoxin subunit